jgi:hypothetical protein
MMWYFWFDWYATYSTSETEKIIKNKGTRRERVRWRLRREPRDRTPSNLRISFLFAKSIASFCSPPTRTASRIPSPSSGQATTTHSATDPVRPRGTRQYQSRRCRRPRPPAPDFFSSLPPPWIGIAQGYPGGGGRRRAALVARGPNRKT